MSAATDALRKALEFLDAVKADPKTASMVGAMRDAREWVEEAAREVVRQDTITQAYRRCVRCDDTGVRWNNAAECIGPCQACAPVHLDAAGYTDLVSDGGFDMRHRK